MRGLTPVHLATREGFAADLLVVGSFQGEPPALDGFSTTIGDALQELAKRPGFRGRDNQSLETLVAHGGGTLSVALRGLGKREQLDAPTLRSWLLSVAEAARRNGIERLALALPTHLETQGEAAALRIARWLMASGYRYDGYLTKREEPELRLGEIHLLPPGGESDAYAAQLPRARAIAKATLLARELGNTPPNVANPSWLEERARQLAEDGGLAIEVLHTEQLEALRMGGILAVGKGSANPPRLLKLAVGDSGPVVALVGKGVTFDTGGISIKPAAAMDEMKYDKCGACNALALATLVAELRLPVRLRVYLPIAENMPDGDAYRPGDIVTCYNGKTVEIVNTDAEGRMILADALALAVEEGAEHLVEFSTLTGACMIALGRNAAGLYSPDDSLASELLTSAERAGERLWRLPLWPELVEQMKGTHADLKNSGERWGSANQAAAFLSQFVGPLASWAHLDIAGPANSTHDSADGVGATGYGIALTIDWLSRLPAR